MIEERESSSFVTPKIVYCKMYAINILMVNVLATMTMATLSNDNTKSSEPVSEHVSCDFLKIHKSDHFIDKTLLIAKLLEAKRSRIYITAPQGFGKSCNLNMLKRFFEIQISDEGERITKSRYDWGELITDTTHYKIFANLKIKQHKNVLDREFGKYPVIWLSLKRFKPILSYEDALEHIKKAVHEMIKEHRYLIDNRRVSERSKEALRKWVDESVYRTFGALDIPVHIELLSQILFQHFNQKCIFLVDDFSSVLSHAMSYVNTSDFEKIAQLCWDVVDPILRKRSLPYSCKMCILTGIFYPRSASNCYTISIYTFSFTEENPLYSLYGITRLDLSNVTKRARTDISQIRYAKSWYGGYIGNTIKLYNTRSVVSFLNNRKIANYWPKNELHVGLTNMFKYSIIRCEIEKLISGGKVEVLYYRKMRLDYLYVFNAALRKPHKLVHDHTKKFLSVLLAYGYLATFKGVVIFENAKEIKYPTFVKIPNEEIKTQFEHYRMQVFQNDWRVDFKLVDDCVRIISKIQFFYINQDEKMLIGFHRTLKALYKSLSADRIDKLDVGVFYSLLLYIYQKANWLVRPPKIVLWDKKYINAVMYRGEGCILFDIRYDGDGENSDGLKYLVEQNETLPAGTDQYFLVSLRITREQNTTMRFLTNSENWQEASVCE